MIQKRKKKKSIANLQEKKNKGEIKHFKRRAFFGVRISYLRNRFGGGLIVQMISDNPLDKVNM